MKIVEPKLRARESRRDRSRHMKAPILDSTGRD